MTSGICMYVCVYVCMYVYMYVCMSLQQKLQELQSRIQSTRERTSTLLQDKDAEISRLKSELSSSNRMNFRLTSQSPNNLAPPLSDDNRSGSVCKVYMCIYVRMPLYGFHLRICVNVNM